MVTVLLSVLALAVAVVIAVLSLLPGDAKAVGWMPEWLQNIGHVGAYALLSFLVAMALVSTLSSTPARFILAFAVATGFGVLMEWLQRGAPGRTASYADALRNALGALFGALAAVVPLA